MHMLARHISIDSDEYLQVLVPIAGAAMCCVGEVCHAREAGCATRYQKQDPEINIEEERCA